MKNRTRLTVVFFVFTAAVFLLSSCKNNKASEYSSFGMGSVFTAKLYSENGTSDKIWADVCGEVGRLDGLISTTDKNSDLSRLYEYGEITADADTVKILKKSLEICEKSGGRLDISIGAITELWGFAGENPSLPEDGDIKAALLTKGTDKIIIDGKTNTVTAEKGLKTDLGAIGKGAACDTVSDIIKDNTKSALFSFGSSIFIWGDNPEKDGWSIGLRNPNGGQNDICAKIFFKNSGENQAIFISTSGSYEKKFEQDGKTYHHILNPETGYPVENELDAVTVISSSGLVSDALSTACFAGGLNKESEELLRSYDAQAIFILKDGSVYFTGELKNSAEITENGFFIIDDYDTESKS